MATYAGGTGTNMLALRTKCSVDRGRADRKQRGADLGNEVDVAMALHHRRQRRDHCFQPLAADPVGRLPKNDQRLAHCLIVDSPFQSEGRRLSRGPARRSRIACLRW
jgi:hypothetical protein